MLDIVYPPIDVAARVHGRLPIVNGAMSHRHALGCGCRTRYTMLMKRDANIIEPFLARWMRSRSIFSAKCIAAWLGVLLSCCALLACGTAAQAYADEVSDAKEALAEAEGQLEALQEEREALEEEIASLQEEIDETVALVLDAQRLHSASLGRLQNSAVFHYKLGGVTLYDMVLTSDSIEDLMDTVNYLDAIEASLARESQMQLDRKASLEQALDDLDAKKDAQDALRGELAAKEDEAKSLVEEAAERVDEAEREKLAEMASLAAPSGPMFSTGEIDGSWRLGFASAYSFADNDGWDATASGIPLDWTSYTVAVPISQRHLLGRSVEISYGGMSLVATVTDVGGFESYGRVLDFAPGVWKAFGASSVNEWGVRQVAYRFL